MVTPYTGEEFLQVLDLVVANAAEEGQLWLPVLSKLVAAAELTSLGRRGWRSGFLWFCFFFTFLVMHIMRYEQSLSSCIHLILKCGSDMFRGATMVYNTMVTLVAAIRLSGWGQSAIVLGCTWYSSADRKCVMPG